MTIELLLAGIALSGAARADAQTEIAGPWIVTASSPQRHTQIEITPAANRSNASLTGTISRIVCDKGFGFIKDGSGQLYFFHHSDVKGSFNDLREGQRVRFDVEKDAKRGPRARNVRPE